MTISLFAAIGANVATMMSLKRSLKREITPQPLMVKPALNYAREEECIGRHQESTGRFQTLDKQIEDLRKERHEDAGKIHEKINAVALQVASLQSDTKKQDQWLLRIDAKLDQVNRKVSE